MYWYGIEYLECSEWSVCIHFLKTWTFFEIITNLLIYMWIRAHCLKNTKVYTKEYYQNLKLYFTHWMYMYIPGTDMDINNGVILKLIITICSVQFIY